MVAEVHDVRRAAVVVVAALLWTSVSGAVRASAPPDVPSASRLSFHDAAGLHVVGVHAIDARQYDVVVSTPALGRAVHVRILVPGDYSGSTRHLPVLYLFHGTSGRASDWVQFGNAEAATARLPLIVVMPDAGFDGDGGGWFTNWVDTHTPLGPSQWETFHVDELIPWVDANLRTVADRSGRAVAGLSQGGFGSTSYAARHPDLFVSAAAFSGAPDIDYDPLVAAGATMIIDATAMGLDGVEPDAMFGSRASDEINWQGHDPADLVDNLRAVDVWLFTATGEPGPYDSGAPNVGASGIELATHGSTESFAQRAQAEHVPFHLVDYTAGTHSWAYWARDLAEYLPQVMRTFGQRVRPPGRVGYESVDARWTQWGWSVAIARPAAQQFSALSDASATGFTLQGVGRAIVTTPALFRPFSVRIVRSSGSRPLRVGADRTGRLHIPVVLGSGPAPPAALGIPVIPGTAVTVTIGLR